MYDENHAQYANVRTGDILLFSGYSFPSLFVRLGTYSEWTHASIAVWLNTDNGRKLHMFEAARFNDEHCALQNSIGKGCRLINIEQVSHVYSKISVRHIGMNRDNEFFSKLMNFMQEFKGKPFPSSFFRIMLVNTGFFQRHNQDDGTILCSELCSLWLEKCGAFKPTIPNYPHYLAVPGHFCDDNKYLRTFSGPLCMLKDDGMDGTIRTAIAFIWFCSLILYILMAADDEKRYRYGHRRAHWKKNKKPEW